ncbi:MAG: hypothetical protein PHQ27_05760, partial [Victivallales bacterium]|nr:hypothetical protein [Victivallales bacterium]
YIVANAIPANFLFGAPWQDIITCECKITISHAELAVLRQTMYHKPVCLLVKNRWIDTDAKTIKNFIQRCLAWGIFPGAFDISPSSYHPYSSYWLYPQWYNRDRTVWRRYLQLIRTIAQAGWQPMPYATSIPANRVRCERFGNFSDGALFYTIRTEKYSGPVTFEIAVKPLQLTGHPIIFDEIANRMLPATVTPEKLTLSLSLQPDEVKLISVNAPAAFRHRRGAAALAWLDSRQKSRTVEKMFGEKLTAWAAKRCWERGAYRISRDVRHHGRQALANADKLDIAQDVYLSQQQPHGLTLGLWCRTEKAGTIKVNVYTHEKNTRSNRTTTLNLNGATHDWEFHELPIPADRPVESLQVAIYYNGGGRVWLDDMTLTSTADPHHNNLLHDGGFEEQLLTPKQHQQLDAAMDYLQQLLQQLAATMHPAASAPTATPEIAPPPTTAATTAAAVYRQLRHIEQWIATQQLQLPAGRELRDLADIRRLLQPVFSEPSLSAP